MPLDPRVTASRHLTASQARAVHLRRGFGYRTTAAAKYPLSYAVDRLAWSGRKSA